MPVYSKMNMKGYTLLSEFSVNVHILMAFFDFVLYCCRFKPPDACYIELMRFRMRPPKNRELPLQLKPSWCVTGNKVS